MKPIMEDHDQPCTWCGKPTETLHFSGDPAEPWADCGHWCDCCQAITFCSDPDSEK